jgi:Integrase core domain
MVNLKGNEEYKVRAGIIKELFRPARRIYPRWSVTQKGFGDQSQCDLVILDKYSKYNRNFKYILLCIDIFTKKMTARPLKTRTAEEVTKQMSEILKEMPPFRLLQTDEEKSFFSRQFQSLMKAYNIKHFFTHSSMKASIIERAIRSFRMILFPRMHLMGKFNWIDQYKLVLNEYNSRKHSKIKMAPNNVKKKHEKLLLNTVYKQVPNFKKQKFRVGDLVRVNLNHNIFTKRSASMNWSTKLYRVKSFVSKSPHIYTLENLDSVPVSGHFYTEELQKTRFPNEYLVEKILKRKPGKIYVKFLNMDSDENCWIDE